MGTTTAKATTATTTTAPASLLAQLQAATPTSATNAQLAQLVTQLQGNYQATQNGIAAPMHGTACITVWCAFMQHCITNTQVPNRAQLLAACSNVNPTTVSVQYGKVKKYLGL